MLKNKIKLCTFPGRHQWSDPKQPVPLLGAPVYLRCWPVGLASRTEDLWESRAPCKLQVEAGQGLPGHLHWYQVSVSL